MMKQHKQVNQIICIFTDGSGSRPDGKGSGFAWLREDNGQRKVVREDNLTNNRAEYRAVLSAIESLDPHAMAEIKMDSENTCFQLKGERRIKDPHLADLNTQIQSVVQKNHLSVTYTWIPRRENRAGKLI